MKTSIRPRLSMMALVLTAGTLTAMTASAAGADTIRFMCDGDSAKGHVELTQYQVNDRLGSLVIQKGGDVITTNVLGSNNKFPVGSRVGDQLFGAPPYSELRLELTREVSISARFRADLWEDNFSHPIALRCRLF